MYQEQRKPTRLTYPRADDSDPPSGTEPRADALPYVVTLYRLSTASGTDRQLPHAIDFSSDLFCEVSPELAVERGLVHGGWATIATAHSAIEARVLVTACVAPLRVDGAVIHQISIPINFGPNVVACGDAVSQLSAIGLDANSQIQELKSLSADIRPGRRPPARVSRNLVASRRQHAGIPA